MKWLLIVVGVLGVMVFAGAEAAAPRYPWTGQSKTWARDGDVMRLRGEVKVVVSGVTFMADEADIAEDTGIASLRGNVRALIPPATTR